jgi:DNA-binding MarR family transcriptional regulator
MVSQESCFFQAAGISSENRNFKVNGTTQNISCYDIISFLMLRQVSIAEYRALAALRYRIRLFLHEGDAAARRLGLEPQQYVLLLTLRGLPGGVRPTIHALAERLGLKHNTTVELIDRLAKRGYVTRNRSRDDRRCVIVSPLPRGEKLLEQVARQRLTELRAGGESLVDALHALLGQKWKSRSKRSRR